MKNAIRSAAGNLMVVVVLGALFPSPAKAEHLMITPGTCRTEVLTTAQADRSNSTSFAYDNGSSSTDPIALVCDLNPRGSSWSNLRIAGTRSATSARVTVTILRALYWYDLPSVVRTVESKSPDATGSFDTSGTDDNGGSAGTFTEPWSASYRYWIRVEIDRASTSDSVALYSIYLN